MQNTENLRGEFLPWTLETRGTPAQLAHQRELIAQNGGEIGENCFVSALADIYDMRLSLGKNSVICANALLRSGQLTTGENCSVNTYAYLQGPITLGNGVRIGPKASLIASNHGHADITRPIVAQPLIEKGITVGDDVWIGANSVLVDGVCVGSHSIIAAGSVVTKPVGDYVIVGGSPARVLKNRIEAYYKDRISDFCTRVAAEMASLVAAHYQNGIFVDTSVNQLPVRACCDAVELLAMFPPADAGLFAMQTHIAYLQTQQTDSIDYSALCVGYALEVLGAPIKAPYTLPQNPAQWLDALSWSTNVWHAGHLVDCLGSAAYQNGKYFASAVNADAIAGTQSARSTINAVFAWLDAQVNPRTGLWGDGDLHDCVNGFYRLTRGTYAQFNRALPEAEKAIDSILHHAQNPQLFANDNGTACDVLDVIHPLWLCKKQTMHRFDEGRSWAFLWIDKILANWDAQQGFSFDLLKHDNPTLMGTEMWLSILYLLCDYVGIAALLPYVPQGVHRPKTDGTPI